MKIKDIFNPDIYIEHTPLFITEWGELMYDGSTDRYSDRKTFLKNYGNNEICNIAIGTHETLNFTFKYAKCPCNDWNCPYYYKGKCTCDNPVDECDEMRWAEL